MKNAALFTPSRSYASLIRVMLLVVLITLIGLFIAETFSFFKLFEVKTAIGPSIRLMP